MAQGSESESQLIVDAIKQGSRDAFAAVYDVVISTHALEYTEKCADEAAQKAIEALSILPASDFKEALITLAQFSVQRDH
jgi:octaprenyl-diphosphate synthase